MTRAKVAVILIALFTLLLLVGVLTYRNRAPASDGELIQEVTTPRPPVRTVLLKPQLLLDKLVSTGVLKAKQDVILSAEVPGKVKKVLKALGDKCNKGELLLQLDTEGYRIGLSQAKAALAQSEISLDHATRNWNRMQQLKASAVATAQQLDSAEGSVSSGEATVEQAKAALQLAARNLRETNVRCPFTCFVAQRMVDTGQTVLPQTPLARLVDTSELKMVLSVTSAELSRLKVGQTVVIRDPTVPGRSYTGSVFRLGVAADALTKNFPVEVLLDDKESRLHTGQVVHTSLELEEHRDVLAVPVEAVFTSGTTQFVLAVSKDKAQKVIVTTGTQIEEQVIITSGLQPGDEVIVVGGDDLVNGAEVTVVNREDKAKSPPASEAKASSETK